MSSTPVGYTERVSPAWWVWVVAAGFAGSFGIVLSRVDPAVSLAATALVLALCAYALVRTTPTVAVDPEVFVAGRARIPLGVVSKVEPLDATAMQRARTVELDVRAYLLLRGWVPGGVRVTIADPEDDTPYWLVSSRSPQRLADALESARAGHRRL